MTTAELIDRLTALVKERADNHHSDCGGAGAGRGGGVCAGYQDGNSGFTGAD